MNISDVAAKYLSYRTRSTGELRKHLQKKGYDQDEIEQVICEFTELRYLDDEDYCHQYICYAQNKGKGRQRIRQELTEKGIHQEIIQNAMEDCVDAEEEFMRALKQAEKTMGGKPMDEKMKGRVGRRLISLGYSMDIVYKVIGRMERR